MMSRKIIDASLLDDHLELEADVVVVGTGAGGGFAAEILAAAGLKVVMLEEGGYYTNQDFTLLERDAFRDLYQENAARKTKDSAINILQGKAVGGTTVVNWTSSFRTPANTLAHWRSAWGMEEYTPSKLAPWFQEVERKLDIAPWTGEPNPNNDVVRRGAEKLGWHWGVMRRNVRRCQNLGYCGMGCPVNAKRSMLVTTVPAALDIGATLVHRVRAERLNHRGDRIHSVVGLAMDRQGRKPTGKKVTVKATHFVLSAGAIGSPALLMRSKAPDPEGLLGKRTFLHPVNISVALMPETVEPFHGAPQSIYSDHFLWPGGASVGEIGYKLEVPPMFPLLSAAVTKTHGVEHAKMMAQLPNKHAAIALMRDGFHPESVGGSVELFDDGSPILDYPVSDVLWDGFRRAYLSMAEMQFAAGAKEVYPLHTSAQAYTSWRQAKAAIQTLPMEIFKAYLGSAHVMGGCPMGGDSRTSLVDTLGGYRHLENLSVMDGSVFPTSVGANPQLSIYCFAMRNATALSRRLKTKG